MCNSIVPIAPVELERALALRDLSDESQGAHAMQLMLRELTGAASTVLGLPATVNRMSPLVAVSDNYDELLIGPEAVSRSRRYSRYVDESHMLRSHTSSAMPGLLRALATRTQALEPVLLAVPGLVYRRDQIDRTHVGEPHQLDLWSVTNELASQEDLIELMGALANAVLPGCSWRVISAEHSYTVQGLQLEVLREGEWLELAEGGLIHPQVLERSGLGSSVSGLALGLGLDRALMLRKGIPDIRYLRSTRLDVLSQLMDLERWRAVSSQPLAKRDLSVSVSAGLDEELLGDLCRQALGADAQVLEQVLLISQTSYDELPLSARERLGIEPHQVNVLVRLLLRPLEHTLSAQEANLLRDRVYLSLHEGSNREELTAL